MPVFASQPRMSPYAPTVGEPSPLLQPVMTTSPKTAGGDSNAYRPSFKSPSTPCFKSTRPSFPNPGAGLPVVTSRPNRNGPLPANTRECRPPVPLQYASPRSAIGAAVYFQSNSPVSGTSAYTPSGAVTYITPSTTMGMASDPGFPVRNVHAGFSRSTLSVRICRNGEYRIAPGSFPYEGQSVWAKLTAESNSNAAIRIKSIL